VTIFLGHALNKMSNAAAKQRFISVKKPGIESKGLSLLIGANDLFGVNDAEFQALLMG